MTNSKKIKILSKPLLVLFVVIFLFINWSDISWIFNYKAVYYTLSDFFSSQESTENLTIREEFYQEDSIHIPKIEVEAPLTFSASEAIADIDEALNRGVAHYPSSVLPGEEGKIIVLGHSAPEDWPKVKYHHVFNRLNELEKDNEIIIYFQNKQYRYQVISKSFVEPGTELNPSLLTNSKSVLFLVSCWPPGKLYQRIVIEAQQI